MSHLAQTLASFKEWVRRNPVQATIIALVAVGFLAATLSSKPDNYPHTRMASAAPEISVQPTTTEPRESLPSAGVFDSTRQQRRFYSDGTEYACDKDDFCTALPSAMEANSGSTFPIRAIGGRWLSERNNHLQIGTRVDIQDGVKCFQFDMNEHRCFRGFGDRIGVIIIRDLDPRYRAMIDEACLTLKRAMSKQLCWYKISFDLVDMGTYHMETTRMYVAEKVNIARLSQY